MVFGQKQDITTTLKTSIQKQKKNIIGNDIFLKVEIRSSSSRQVFIFEFKLILIQSLLRQYIGLLELVLNL